MTLLFEAERMKNEFRDTELSCTEAKEVLASARDLKAGDFSAIHVTINGESVRIDGGS